MPPQASASQDPSKPSHHHPSAPHAAKSPPNPKAQRPMRGRPDEAFAGRHGGSDKPEGGAVTERGRLREKTSAHLKAHPPPRSHKIFGADTPRWLTALASASLSPPRDQAKAMGGNTRRVAVDEEGGAGGGGAYMDMVRRAPGPSLGGLQDAPGVNSARRDGSGSARARDAIQRRRYQKEHQAPFLSSDEDGQEGPPSRGDGPKRDGWHTMFVKHGGMDGQAKTPPGTSRSAEDRGNRAQHPPHEHAEHLRDHPGEMQNRRKAPPAGARLAHNVTFDFFRLGSEGGGGGGGSRPGTSQDLKDRTELWLADNLRRSPNDAGLLRRYAVFLHDEGRLVEAEHMYKRALGANSKDAACLCALATLMWEMERKARAEELLRQALHADPGHPESLASYGALLLNKGEAKAAHTRFRLALMSRPGDPSLLLNNALAMEEIQSYAFEEVEDMYQRAVEAETEGHEALLAYALFLKNRIGEVDGAERAYVAALRRCPTDPSLLASYAILLTERMGVGEGGGGGAPESDLSLFTRAERAFKQSLAVDPAQADNVYSYAVLLAKWAFLHGDASGADQGEEVEALFRRALSLRKEEDPDTLCAFAIYLHEKELRRRQRANTPGEGARRQTPDGVGRAKSGGSSGSRLATPNTQATPKPPSGGAARLPSGGGGRVASGVASGEGMPVAQEGRRRTPDGKGTAVRESVSAGGRGRTEEIDRLYRRAIKAQPGHELAVQGYVGFLRTFRGVEGEKAALKLDKERLSAKHQNTFRRSYEIQPAHNRIALHHMNLPARV